DDTRPLARNADGGPATIRTWKTTSVQSVNPRLAQAEHTLVRTKQQAALVESIFNTKTEFERDGTLWGMTEAARAGRRRRRS
ncbi:unnamed protein product, partial [Heterosigma akashiwo]